MVHLRGHGDVECDSESARIAPELDGALAGSHCELGLCGGHCEPILADLSIAKAVQVSLRGGGRAKGGGEINRGAEETEEEQTAKESHEERRRVAVLEDVAGLWQ